MTVAIYFIYLQFHSVGSHHAGIIKLPILWDQTMQFYGNFEELALQ